MALLLDCDTDGPGHIESSFIDTLAKWLVRQIDAAYRFKWQDYYKNLLKNTVYTSEFHELLRSQESYIASSLLTSLQSPEIYNDIATYLLHSLTTNLSHQKLVPVKLLYDIACGLAQGSEEYYLPKYRFNRVRCDFLEMKSAGPLTSDEEVPYLVSTIDELHLSST